MANFFVHTGLDTFRPVRCIFPNTAMSSCNPSTYRSIVFRKSRICRTVSDSMSVSSGDSIWGSICWYMVTVFFSTWCFWMYFIGTSNFFWLKLFCGRLSDVGPLGCQRTWTSPHNQKSKYAMEQKKRPLRVNP
jgi:hypothetical protein